MQNLRTLPTASARCCPTFGHVHSADAQQIWNRLVSSDARTKWAAQQEALLELDAMHG
jgi:hypothetical protein